MRIILSFDVEEHYRIEAASGTAAFMMLQAVAGPSVEVRIHARDVRAAMSA
jgi:hypothetical protein